MTESAERRTFLPSTKIERRLGLLGTTVVVLLGAALVRESLQLGVGTLSRPGSGLWPLIVSFTITVAGLLLTLVILTRGVTPMELTGTRRALVLGGALVAYALLLPYLGYWVLTPLLVLGVSRIIAGHSWVRSVLYAVLAPLGVYLVFSFGFGVPMPLWPSL